MRILYYDCFAGISGDMNLAALLDVGLEPDILKNGLAGLGLDGEFALRIAQAARNGIKGTRVDVDLAHQDGAHGEGGHHHNAHHHDHEHHHDHAHHHRAYSDIRALIAASTLEPRVRDTALAIFQKVAEAEAKVHNVPVDQVAFHELGAVDSIVDIVGAAIGLCALQVNEVWAASVELGGGMAYCAHGTIPVPAPATAEILRGFPTRRGGTDFESTTPTGAAILAATVDRWTDTPRLRTLATGYGVGHREGGRLPNLLRVHLAETVEDAVIPGANERPARLLQCNIDDMTGEELGALLDFFLHEGAMDAHFTPIVMKKNRPATQFSVLCAEEDEPRFRSLLFRRTTSLGVKSFALTKTGLARRMVSVQTPLGAVRMKEALWGDTVLRAKPEFDDCLALAGQHGLTPGEVAALAREAWRK